MIRNIPNCNRSFLIEALLENKRVDGRSLHQFRDLQVNFGQTFGSCYVQLGHTVIFASTEASIDEPRVTRPSEGLFKVSINIGSGGKDKWLRQLERAQPKEAVLTMRLLEKIINRINVLDLESLCLVTGRFVWCINTKLVLFNFDGNLIEAASIATIASLMHFKRPDATVTAEGNIIVHSFETRNPIPLTLFHYPICVTFQFMDHTLLKKILSENQEIFPEQHSNRVRKAMQLMVCDPTEEEEDFLKNVLVICTNTYREIVAIQSLGRLSLASFSKQLLNNCSTKAFERVHFVTNYLKEQLDKHYKQLTCSTSNSLQRYDFIEAIKSGDLCIVKNYKRNPIFGKGNSFTLSIDENNIGEGGVSSWIVTEDNCVEEDTDDDSDQDLKEEYNINNSNNFNCVEPSQQKFLSYSKVLGRDNALKIKSELPETKQINEFKTEIDNGKSTSKVNDKKLEPKEQTNQWIKVNNKKNIKDTQMLSSGKKRKNRKKKSNKVASSNEAANKQLSSDEEDNVFVLNSEYSK